jgi:hypothetical protein
MEKDFDFEKLEDFGDSFEQDELVDIWTVDIILFFFILI